MSDQYQPDFTAWGAISSTFQVICKESKFFGTMIFIYVILYGAPYLFLFDGIDFTNPEAIFDLYSAGNPLFLI